MLTAIDTNIISALWSGEPTAASAEAALQKARRRGGLVISAPVFTELVAHPHAKPAFVDVFLESTGISVDFHLDEVTWRLAGERFAHYAIRRRKSGAREAKRLLVDFLVGAHAVQKAAFLLTLDSSPYRNDFPEISLEVPL